MATGRLVVHFCRSPSTDVRPQPLQSSLLNCWDKFWLKLVDKKGWNGGILLEKTYIFPAAHI